MPHSLYTYLTGLALNAGLIVVIGALNAHVLRQGLKREYLFLVAAICSSTDILLITLGTLGFGTLIGSFPLLTKIAAWAGAVFLFFYGFLAFRSARQTKTLRVEDNTDGGGSPRSLKSIILLTLAVSLLNPHVYLDTVILIGGIAAQYPVSERIFFAMGAGTVSVIWFFGLAYGAGLLASLFRKPLAWQIMDIIIGLIMWGIATSLVVGELSQ
jgi:L-lysine exporter family protein LysE/ArgO